MIRRPPRSTLFPSPPLSRSGIQLSDDPLPPLRSAVYALSLANRRSPSPAAPATAQQQNVEPTWLSFDTAAKTRSEEHTSELQSLAYLVCRLLLEKKKKNQLI